MFNDTPTRYTVELDKIDGPYRGLVGTKALNLGIIAKTGIRVPAGFVITTDAYRALMSGPLGDSIREHLRESTMMTPHQLKRHRSEFVRL